MTQSCSFIPGARARQLNIHIVVHIEQDCDKHDIRELRRPADTVAEHFMRVPFGNPLQ